MATLTADELSYIRDVIGDHTLNKNGVYELPDLTLQAIYDSTAQGNSDLSTTIVYALRRLVGRTARLVATSGNVQDEQRQQWHEHLRELLKTWEAITGLTPSGGSLVVGEIGLGLDATYESEYES